MIKVTFIVLLSVAVTVSSIPIEEPELSKSGLVRPSPINPDVVSEPLPLDGVSTTTQTTSHIQKIPARGTKLSATLDQDKLTTISEAPKEKRETVTDATTTQAKSNFRRDQPSTPSTVYKQSGVTTTTAEPVSLKTPIVHPSGLKVRRSADDTSITTSKTPSTTTRGPLPSSDSSSSSNNNNYDDNSGPHFVRPVPVDQILKNLHEAAPQHHHEQAKAVETTTGAAAESETSPGTTVNDHKFHRKTKTSTTEAPAEDEERESHEDGKDSSSSEDDSKQ